LQKNYGRLTPRERQVLTLRGVRLLNKDRPPTIWHHEVTIGFHRAQIIASWGALAGAELVRMADMMGIGRGKRSEMIHNGVP